MTEETYRENIAIKNEIIERQAKRLAELEDERAERKASPVNSPHKIDSRLFEYEQMNGELHTIIKYLERKLKWL